MRFELEGRVVLITGASGGIGRACAVEFHRNGAKVVAAARSGDRLAELQNELGSDRLEAVVMDVTDSEQRQAGLDRARQRFGFIDVLVNNAGWASFGSLLHLPAEHLDRMFALNLSAPVAMIQAVLPEMIERRSGQIVNISSVVGYQPLPRMAFYSATKAALNALSSALRMELRGSGVDVILIAPSSTNTGFFQAAEQTDTKAIRFEKGQHPPEQVARAVVRGCRNRRKEVVLSLEGKLLTVIRRISHRLADSIIRRVADRSMPLRESSTDEK
ncbi:MAG: SDR family oxidoreductase [Planctomycetota bacterium]